jgi:ubiquinone/menaquinone biosynthesis C-methylase UbiE
LLKNADKSQVSTFFDNSSLKYGLFNEEMTQLLSKFEKQQILKQIIGQMDSSMLVLEAGCGWGRYLSVVSRYSSMAIGIDLSKRMLLEGKKRFRNLNIHLIRADMENLPFKDDTFKIVYSIRAFKYPKDPTNVLKGFHKVCQSSASIFIYDINNILSADYVLHLVNSCLRFIAHYPASPWREGISKSTPFLIKRYFKDSGCDNVSHRGILYIPEIFYQGKRFKRIKKRVLFLEKAVPSFFSFLGYGILYKHEVHRKLATE